MQKEFEFFITKVYHGVGAARKLGDIVKKVGAKKVMVFHGPNVKAAGLVDPCLKSLERGGGSLCRLRQGGDRVPVHS